MSNQVNQDTKKRSLTGIYAMVQGSYWMGFVVYGAFSSFYLLEAGLSNTIIGVILSVSALIGALLSPSVGAMIDRSPWMKNREIIAIMGLLIAVFSVGIYLVPLSSPLGTGIVFALTYFFTQLVCPFINALGAEYMNAGYELNFGVSRAGGSICYATMAVLMGSLTVKYGTICVPIISFVSFLIMMGVALLLLPKLGKGRREAGVAGKTVEEKVETDAESQARNASVSPVAFMKKYPTYMGFLAGLILIYFAHNFVNVYALQILVTKGGNSQSVGIAAAIGAIAECVPMVTYKWIRKKFSMTTMIRIASIFFILKELLTLLVPTPTAYMFVMLLQAFAWGVVAVTIVYYVNDIIDLENASQGQAYAGMAVTLGTVLCSFICGLLMDQIGVNATLVVATVVCAVGAVIVWMTTKDDKKA